MIAATAIVVMTFRYHEIEEYVDRAEANNARMATLFSNIFLKEFSPLIQTMSAADPQVLKQRAELRALDVVLRTLKRLIDDLLAYSRVTSRSEAFSAVDTADVLTAVLRSLEVAIAESGATVTAGPLPTVDGDVAQIERLLQNLVGNAVKYRRPGTAPAIRVAAVRDGEGWRFSVRDNGIGIDPEYFDRIFNIFQRLHGRAEYEGTGIGLAICKQIVERHGGRIWVESRPGEGTAFFFTLRAALRGRGPGRRGA